MYNEDDKLENGMSYSSGPAMDHHTEAEAGANEIHKPEPEVKAEHRAETHGWQQDPNPNAYSGSRLTYIPEAPVHRADPPGRKPGSSLGKKIAGITAAALLFGTISGGTMVGINRVAGYLDQQAVATGEAATEAAEESLAMTETQAPVSEPVSTPQVTPAIAMDVSDIVEKAMPSVVAITNTMVYESQNWFGQRQTYEVPSSGSGIILGRNDDELLIVTNNHVVSDAKTLAVTFIDDTSVEAAIKGTDSESDLAVIAVALDQIDEETMSQIQIATLGDSDSLRVGQGVVAIGNALGYGQSVTVGYVSALDREVQTEADNIRNLLQTDAAINPGNSGGALLNMKGEVIGINAAKYSGTEIEGMGYAIPISAAQEIIGELMNKKTRVEVAEESQGYLGIQGQNIDESAAGMYGMPKGVYVFKIVEGGAAANSSLREKDIITKFDGQTVKTMAQLKEMLTYYEGGSNINLTVQSLQDGQYVERNVEITLGYKPEAEEN